MSHASPQVPPFEIAVVIATKNRSAELANRALRSVLEQTRRPDYVVVVDNSDRRYRPSNRRIVATVDIPGARVTYKENDRTAGASGARNVALDFLHRNVQQPENLFVAILDDDDRWTPGYLAACAHHAVELCSFVQRGWSVGSRSASQRLEPEASRARIQKILGAEPRTFAYPDGAWNEATGALVQEAGYAGTVTLVSDVARAGGNMFAISRVLALNDPAFVGALASSLEVL